MPTNEIATYAEKLRENFPQIPVVEIVQIWCEQQGIPLSETILIYKLNKNIY
jgi:hypothetical protein